MSASLGVRPSQLHIGCSRVIDESSQEAVRTQEQCGIPMSEAVVDEQLLPYSFGLVDRFSNGKVGLKHLKTLATRNMKEWQGRDNGISFQKLGRKRSAPSLRNFRETFS